VSQESSTRTTLSIAGLSKTFPGVQALSDVSLDVAPGSVHALLGHNGCGKSTLVKVLAGYHRPDPGSVATVDGEPIELGQGHDAERLGIRFVHQDLGLVSELSVADNVGLVNGYSRRPFGMIRWGRQASATTQLLKAFHVNVDPRRPIGDATPVERVAVAVVRAVAGLQPGRGLLVLDEPTAALPASQVDDLFTLITRIRDSGTAVLLVSHRLDEVMHMADAATVMRNGKVVWFGDTSTMSVRAFSNLIADRDPNAPATAAVEQTVDENAETVLRVENVTGRYCQGVSFSVRRGEILGLAGLVGSGREELPYIVTGAHRGDEVSGTFTFGDAAPMSDVTMKTANANGAVLVPAERATESVFAEFTVKENVSLAALPSISGHMFVSPPREKTFARTWLTSLSADAGTVNRPIATLSGGNQQKAVLARWLSVGPRLLAVSEPTAGIDIGAREAIYAELRQRARDGLSILLASSDAEDLVAVCDRVIVLRDGEIITELGAEAINKTSIIAAMEGALDDE
jgi:ribose transport system ATP-binding protein